MKRKFVIISLLVLCLYPVWGQGQQSLQEQLWEGFRNSLKQDVENKMEKDKRIKSEKETELFQNGIEELKIVLANPHSKRSVQSAKSKIAQLRTSIQQTPDRKEILSKYNQLISDYENQVRRFLSIFNGEITDSTFIRYRSQIGTLTPPKMQTLSGYLKAHYEKNGHDRLTFPEDYVYLNKKLSELKNDFKDLDKISDRGKLSARLDAIVKIESEISDEHKTYHTLK